MISVVIPTSERPDLLARCLANITGADEVIVSDDSSTDRTLQMIQERFPGIKWVRGPRRGPAANRNFGVSQASNDWIAFIDDDCVPGDHWLENLSRALLETNLVEGRTVCPDKTGSLLEEIVENHSGGLLWSCNFGIHRALFMELGGFDEDFAEAGGEDLEFAWRVKQLGVPIRFAPEAIVYHPARRLSLHRWIYRIFQDRWHLLYRLRTTRTRLAVIDECKDLVRITARQVFRLGRKEPWGRALSILLRWILFPLWFSYLLKWELHFRRRLARKSHPGSAVAALKSSSAERHSILSPPMK
jgi:GT2 family glycosyltransferase